ncbi:hypothetical protein HOA59_01690 [archaeon]|jgi:hypothetical protein|nr:hypothetical protein [archaeon]MBT6824128.1 hypothetical protein [archaeon]
MKRGELAWEQIGKFLLAILLLTILVLVTLEHKENISSIFEDFKMIFRYGGS